MNDKRWNTWKMQTSQKWQDIADVLKVTNIDFIDYDHRVLVGFSLRLNMLITHFEEDFCLELLDEIHKLLGDLYQYAVEHFNREERFMDLYQLPNIDQHKKEHKKILAMLKKITSEYAKGKAAVSHKLKVQLMNWLITHINETDVNFFDIDNWMDNISAATCWDDVKYIIHLTGVLDIDDQHRDLTTKAIMLINSLENKENKEIIQGRFKEFRDSVTYHFKYEQKFMTKYKIKYTSQHLKSHLHFKEELSAYHMMIRMGKVDIKEMKVTILSWWINHINVTDKETFNYKNWAYTLFAQVTNIDELKAVLRYTRIDKIDNEHIELMTYTLELCQIISHKAANNSKNEDMKEKKEVLEIFSKIYKCAEKHFSHEEYIMKKFEMHDYLSHQNIHENILKKILDMKINYEKNRLYLSDNLKKMILEWWILHTNTVDYRTFVQSISEDEKVAIEKEEKLYESKK